MTSTRESPICSVRFRWRMSVKDLERLCWAQIALMLILADRNGPQAVVTLIVDLRLNAIKYGDPQTVAALHLFVGEMEAKYGHLSTARKHAEVGQRILQMSENIWLEAVASNLLLATSILRADVRSGLDHGLHALRLAEESGAASTLRASLGNLGNLFHISGDFERAVNYFDRALVALPSCGEKSNATLDSLARVTYGSGSISRISSIIGFNRMPHSRARRTARCTRIVQRNLQGHTCLFGRDELPRR